MDEKVREIEERWGKGFNTLLSEGYLDVTAHAIRDIKYILSRISQLEQELGKGRERSGGNDGYFRAIY